MPYTATTVASTIDKINRSYFLPAIQRPFVWNAEQVLSLFDSLMKGYPISSFLFWDVAPENKPNWQIYKFAENFRYGEVHNEIAETDGRDVTLVLDGQQRLTSLLIGLRGSFTVKAKNKHWDSPSAWLRKRLYIDLLKDPTRSATDDNAEEGIENPYGFELFENAPPSVPGRFWIKVGEILNYPGDDAFDRYKDNLVDRLPETASRLDEKTVNRNLTRLHRMVWKDEIICYYTEKDQDYDRVLGIFVRANDGGTKLSKSDLMLSMISSKWADISAREEIYSFVDMLNTRLDKKNEVNKDFVMKGCLLLSDLDHVYQVKNFTSHNLEIMRKNWPRIKAALRRTFLLVNRFGIDRETLTSLNALLPIAYYLYKIDTDLLEGSTAFDSRNAERIRRWLVSSLLNGVFGGNSDGTIGASRNTIHSSLTVDKEFPLTELYSALTKQRKRAANINAESLANVIEIKYGQKPTFLVLSLLYDDKNWGAIPHHLDHIFPKSLINRRTLMGMNIHSSRVDEILETADRIGNLQLLTSHDNLIKTNQKFEEWIQTRDHSFLDRHLIPEDRQLWDLRMLPEFVAAREKLIAKRLLSLQGDVADTSSRATA
ncbi:DUF262 domain-containing protein [Mesorhizobium sp. L2C084A000]|uniref:DUF262 domain-containing protein n=1 Tax=Mesorhizobium sp. L2C084A000 TaxID=1287116 RepID=UPI0003D01254|nr:DUF262 domain-containing protein [Mesorhizobium sp. L2C084A000]ESZ30425.1 hypothetical protein X734_03880 [Mesorhizobium sp. L2C084A000]